MQFIFRDELQKQNKLPRSSFDFLIGNNFIITNFCCQKIRSACLCLIVNFNWVHFRSTERAFFSFIDLNNCHSNIIDLFLLLIYYFFVFILFNLQSRNILPLSFSFLLLPIIVSPVHFFFWGKKSSHMANGSFFVCVLLLLFFNLLICNVPVATPETMRRWRNLKKSINNYLNSAECNCWCLRNCWKYSFGVVVVAII